MSKKICHLFIVEADEGDALGFIALLAKNLIEKPEYKLDSLTVSSSGFISINLWMEDFSDEAYMVARGFLCDIFEKSLNI